MPAINTDTCLHCGNPVRVSIFRGDHYCSDNCLKALTEGTGDRDRVHQIYAQIHGVDDITAPVTKKATTPAKKRA